MPSAALELSRDSMPKPLKKELATFERERERLEAEHKGKHVLIHGDEVIGTFDTFQNAAEEGIRRFGKEPFLIRQVGQNEIELPVSFLHGLTVARSA